MLELEPESQSPSDEETHLASQVGDHESFALSDVTRIASLSPGDVAEQ